ncbi:DNA-3-methyladenine glycosylase 2 family protein [Halorubrum sp. JWXQ-INN 858]|uniref:DNA-3-methyladenine glycosylase family protein n=1 Tax=Halorubrum sp. JWXQ-INN 858 TaxID=2690782 RepID=UPI0013586C3B|nr:DNA-3-methyladenine glycosylase 2 family protein [Halorubrum sp. JWXQ-INN 858]MWV64120.1 DNA-3-methyladenine glycosylase 2 family protein [Halorubrum sp. JWXQ-INN 858]
MDDEVERTLRADPVLARLIDRHGRLSVEPAADEFERLCVSVLNQQLSTASAAAIRGRVFDLLDDEVTPERVLDADPERLREAGVSGTKVRYLRAAATAFTERDLTREGLASMSDDAVVDELTTIHGVGEWTARMYLIGALGREDVLPLGDLAVRRGIEALYNDGAELSRAEMRAIADPWRPYRSYGTRYVWAAYES